MKMAMIVGVLTVKVLTSLDMIWRDSTLQGIVGQESMMGLLIMTQMVMMPKGTTGKRHDYTLNMQKILLKETKERKQPVQMFCTCEEIRSDCFSIEFLF